jgi:hypothetical protein
LNSLRFKTLLGKKSWKKTLPKYDHPMAWRCAPRLETELSQNGPFWPLPYQVRSVGHFYLPLQGHPDSILNPFSGTFQPPPGPHRQLP